MSKKHFTALAQALRSARPTPYRAELSGAEQAAAQTWEDTVTSVSNALRQFNGAYDEGRFLTAAGFGDWEA